jgi:hypothetical protein
MRPRNV